MSGVEKKDWDVSVVGIIEFDASRFPELNASAMIHPSYIGFAYKTCCIH